MTNPQLYVLLYPERQEKAKVYLEPDCARIHRELSKKGVKLTLLWKEYQVICSNSGRVPYQYTQFCDIYRAWAKKSKATMRIHYKPGDAMEVDWAGGTLPIKNPITGETVPAYLFVGILPCSCYAYAELCSDMKSENWLLCHVHTYEYFGGVPRLTIPDNLRTGVLKKPVWKRSLTAVIQSWLTTMALQSFLRVSAVRRTRVMLRVVSPMPLHGSWRH